MGKKEPDVDRFRQLSAEVEVLLRQIYPDFAGAPPKQPTEQKPKKEEKPEKSDGGSDADEKSTGTEEPEEC